MDSTDAHVHLAHMIHRGHLVTWVVQTIGVAVFLAAAGSGLLLLVTSIFDAQAVGVFLSAVLCLVGVPLWMASQDAPRPSDEVRRHLGLPSLEEK